MRSSQRMSAMGSPAGLWLAACLAGAGCRDAVAPDERGSPAVLNNAPPPLQPIGPVLAFQRQYPDGNSDIFSVATSGQSLTQLTFGSAADSQPAWSPDGKKLAWVRAASGISQIYVMNPDGSGKTNLSNSNTRDRLPVWSPNGSRILFERRVVNLMLKTYWEIYVMNADGSGQTNLSKHAATDQHARWSPSGNQVVFTSQRDGNRDLYRVNADGTGLLRLTSDPRDDDYADWSPGGRTIAFDRFNTGSPPVYEWVYTMTFAGGGETLLNVQVDGNAGGAFHPRWSPDGSKLLLLYDGGDDLVVLNGDGSDPLELDINGSSGGPGDAVWSPDCKRIAYSNWEPYGGNDAYGIRTASADGSLKQMVTNNVHGSGIYDEWPTWKP